MMKGWIIMMGWMGLCSTELVFASNSEHSSKIAKHSDSDEDSDGFASHKREKSVDLSSLHSALKDDGDRDLLEGNGRKAKYHHSLLGLLGEYLLDIPDGGYSDEEFSESSTEEDSDADSDEYSTEKCGEKLFVIARHLKARFTLEERIRMNIDLKKLLEIELLFGLPKSRKWTSEENFLFNEALRALDRSPERRRLFILQNDANMMDNVE
jgi:hypothetical protein